MKALNQSATRSIRTMVLVDIENQTGSASPTRAAVITAYTRLRDLLGDGPHCLYTVACSHHAAATVRFALPTGRHRWRSGRDGADSALADIIYHEQLHRNFDRVVIASGDAYLVEAVHFLKSHGVQTIVASEPNSLSRHLRHAADNVIELPPSSPTPTDNGPEPLAA